MKDDSYFSNKMSVCNNENDWFSQLWKARFPHDISEEWLHQNCSMTWNFRKELDEEGNEYYKFGVYDNPFYPSPGFICFATKEPFELDYSSMARGIHLYKTPMKNKEYIETSSLKTFTEI